MILHLLYGYSVLNNQTNQTISKSTISLLDESCPKIKVLSNDHRSGEVGMYFNFDGKSIDWKGKGKMALQVLNTRNGKKGEVMMWNKMNGGSKGTAHGRWNPFSSKKKGDWQVGDVLAVYCSKCLVSNLFWSRL